MIFTTLDIISKGFLLKKRYSLHWYVDAIIAARDCLSSLSKDDLRVVNTKRLPVNKVDNSVALPSDYLDYVKCALLAGQFVKPLVEDRTINSLNNFDSSMNVIRYDESENNSNNPPVLYYGGYYGALWTTHFNQWGESSGRFFGLGDTTWDSFKIVPERGVIQLNERLDVEEIVLLYIGTGEDADAATHVHPYCKETIEAYINWQFKEHRRDISEMEKDRAQRLYVNQRRILRARMNPLTIEVLKKIIQRNTRQSIK